MIWKNKYSTEWRTRFALFPVEMGGNTIWLQRYRERYVESKTTCRGCHTIGWWEREAGGEK